LTVASLKNVAVGIGTDYTKRHAMYSVNRLKIKISPKLLLLAKIISSKEDEF